MATILFNDALLHMMIKSREKFNKDEKLIFTESIFTHALNSSGFIEKMTGELLGYRAPVDAKKQKTLDKWQPYQRQI